MVNPDFDKVKLVGLYATLKSYVTLFAPCTSQFELLPWAIVGSPLGVAVTEDEYES